MRQAIAGLLLAGVTGGVLALGTSAAQADASVPYSDPRATSSLALCGKDGQPVTSGSIDQRPFVWRAVSAVGAPAPYDESGSTATLFGFQPRPEVEPAEWSGDLLTASARFTNPAHPMAASTDTDEPLSTFLSAYPTKVDGLVQLRLYLGAPQQPAYTLKYAAANIQITGRTWHLVGAPSTASCTSGRATSLESILHPANVTTTTPVGGSATATATASGSAASSLAPTTAAAPDGAVVEAASDQNRSLAADSGNRYLTDIVKGALAVLAAGLLAVGAWWGLRRRTGARS